MTGLLDTLGRRNRKNPDKACEACGKTYRPARSSARFCSRPCMWSMNGKHQVAKDECWWVSQHGYIHGRIRVDGVVMKVKQHRVVVERHLGRKLLAHEDVHHINGDKADNRIENLQVIDHGEHTRITNKRQYARGYKLNLTAEQRRAWSERSRAARRALSKARGDT